MSIENAIEEKIREAIERGDFDNLSGKGRRLDLEAYFNTPEDLRMAFSILKSDDFVPEEVELMREIDRLRQLLASEQNAQRCEDLRTRVSDRTLALSLLMDRRRRR